MEVSFHFMFYYKDKAFNAAYIFDQGFSTGGLQPKSGKENILSIAIMALKQSHDL